MNVVILGAGLVGFQLADELIREGNDVVIIEKNPDRARYVAGHLDCMVINDEGTRLSTFKKARLARADFFISVTNMDEVNMISCGIVSGEYPDTVRIARVRNADYSRAGILSKSFLGIDFVVNPEVETARNIANAVALGADSDVMLFENSDMQIRNLVVKPTSFFRGRTMKDIKKTLDEPFLVAGIARGDDFIIPSGDTAVLEHDNIYLLASKNTLTRIFIKAGKKKEKIDRLVIVGGGKIGQLACQHLIRTGRRITFVESDYEICKALSSRFKRALVLHSDISDEDIFEQEKLSEYDLIVTTTNNEELNILTSVYAKSLGIKKAMALVSKASYMPIAARLNIDSIINPKHSTVDAILKFLRRGDIRSVHSLFGGKAEVIEFIASETCTLAGKRLMDIAMPHDSLILTILREGERDIIPGGDSVIRTNDRIVVISSKESVPEVDRFFSGTDR
ncbi:MAG TPA: Trk system potassium transporter TrkA [Spirochaetota bacterium]|nr:Trk system potassium transporter TrkA [Spirochaetota bacterium]HNT11548.1 Trk system potassium transporter TrkA [Spirochaetota bacterium]